MIVVAGEATLIIVGIVLSLAFAFVTLRRNSSTSLFWMLMALWGSYTLFLRY